MIGHIYRISDEEAAAALRCSIVAVGGTLWHVRDETKDVVSYERAKPLPYEMLGCLNGASKIIGRAPTRCTAKVERSPSIYRLKK